MESSSCQPEPIVSSTIVESVKSRSLDQNDIYTKGIVANIISTNTSSILNILNELLPLLHHGFGHLKRARKCPNNITEVLICSSCHKSDIPKSITELCLSMFEIDVAKIPPETNEEYIAWGNNWPINFRPSTIVREISQTLPTEAIQQNLYFMSLANLDGQHFNHHIQQRNKSHQNMNGNDDDDKDSTTSSRKVLLNNRGGAIIIDSLTQQVIMTSYDAYIYLCHKHGMDKSTSLSPSSSSSLSHSNDDTDTDDDGLLNHPLYTPTMMCIEGVAALVRGECVMHHTPTTFSSTAAVTINNNAANNNNNNPCDGDDGMRNIDGIQAISSTICTNSTGDNKLSYVSQDYFTRDSGIIDTLSPPSISNSNSTVILAPTKKLTTDHNYLCCGLDLYVTYEPDIMSCMALVHSRIHSVYFEQLDTQYGGLGSKMYIHSLRSLNHHYRAFRVIPSS